MHVILKRETLDKTKLIEARLCSIHDQQRLSNTFSNHRPVNSLSEERTQYRVPENLVKKASMNRYTKVSSTPDAVCSTSFFSKPTKSLKNAVQDSCNDDDLKSAMAIFPEFFCPFDTRHKNVQREKMPSKGEPENYPRGIEGWYKSEFGIK